MPLLNMIYYYLKYMYKVCSVCMQTTEITALDIYKIKIFILKHFPTFYSFISKGIFKNLNFLSFLLLFIPCLDLIAATDQLPATFPLTPPPACLPAGLSLSSWPQHALPPSSCHPPTVTTTYWFIYTLNSYCTLLVSKSNKKALLLIFVWKYSHHNFDAQHTGFQAAAVELSLCLSDCLLAETHYK